MKKKSAGRRRPFLLCACEGRPAVPTPAPAPRTRQARPQKYQLHLGRVWALFGGVLGAGAKRALSPWRDVRPADTNKKSLFSGPFAAPRACLPSVLSPVSRSVTLHLSRMARLTRGDPINLSPETAGVGEGRAPEWACLVGEPRD